MFIHRWYGAFFVVMNKMKGWYPAMIAISRHKRSPISQNSGVVKIFSPLPLCGFNAQNKEFVKRVLEKSLSPPDAQNESLVNSILKNSLDFSALCRSARTNGIL